MLGTVAFTFLLQMAVIYIPFLQGIFKTTPLTLAELAGTIGLGVLTFLIIEMVKWIRSNRAKSI